jgi:hypothetical protein
MTFYVCPFGNMNFKDKHVIIHIVKLGPAGRDCGEPATPVAVLTTNGSSRRSLHAGV